MANELENYEKQESNLVWHSSVNDTTIQHASWQNYDIKLNWTPHQTSQKTTASGSIVVKGIDGASEIFTFSYDSEQYAVLSDKGIIDTSNEPAELKCRRLNISNEDYEIIINESGERLYRIL